MIRTGAVASAGAVGASTGVLASAVAANATRTIAGVPSANANRQGPGGRSSVSGLVATVFGPTGFLGRYTVNKLGKMGSQVVVPYRGDFHDTRHLKLMGDLGQIVPTKFDPHDRESIRDLVGHSNVVVNLMGIDYETRNWSFEQTHVELAATVAEEAARVGAERLVHVSALGADPASPSEFLASKGRGEAAVTAAFPDATILRPGTMVGNEDRLILRLANLAKKFRVIALTGDGSHQYMPVYVGDVATAIHNSLSTREAAGKIYDICGDNSYTERELAQYCINVMQSNAVAVPVPEKILGMASPFVSALPNARFTEDQLARAGVHEVGDNTAMKEELGVKLNQFEVVSYAILRRFRKTMTNEDPLDNPHDTMRLIKEASLAGSV